MLCLTMLMSCRGWKLPGAQTLMVLPSTGTNLTAKGRGSPLHPPTSTPAGPSTGVLGFPGNAVGGKGSANVNGGVTTGLPAPSSAVLNLPWAPENLGRAGAASGHSDGQARLLLQPLRAQPRGTVLRDLDEGDADSSGLDSSTSSEAKLPWQASSLGRTVFGVAQARCARPYMGETHTHVLHGNHLQLMLTTA